MLTFDLHDAVVFTPCCHGQVKLLFICVMKLGFFKMFLSLMEYIVCLHVMHFRIIFLHTKSCKSSFISWNHIIAALESFFGDLLVQRQWSKWGWLECVVQVFAQAPGMETSLKRFAALFTSVAMWCTKYKEFNPT